MAERLLENITPNSDKYRSERVDEEKRVIRKVQTGNVRIKKRSLFSSIADTFIREKPAKVGKYVLQEVVVPAIMDTIYDCITSAIGMTFYKKADRRRFGGNSNTIGSKFNYSAISAPSVRKERTPVYGGSKGSFRSFDNLVFESKGKAEEVRDSMLEYIDKYGSLSVLNFYDIAQVSMDDCPFTDNNWGWKRDSIGQMKVIGDIANGFYINLPRCEPID